MICNYCTLKRLKKEAEARGNKIITRRSSFLDGIDVFEIGKDEEVPEHYIEPCDKFPNGDEWFETHHVAWMKEIGRSCCC